MFVSFQSQRGPYQEVSESDTYTWVNIKLMSFNLRINSKRGMYIRNVKYIKMYNNNISSTDD